LKIANKTPEQLVTEEIVRMLAAKGPQMDSKNQINLAGGPAVTTKVAEQLSKGHTSETEMRENRKSIGYEF
jgi:hypothetical protein